MESSITSASQLPVSIPVPQEMKQPFFSKKATPPDNTFSQKDTVILSQAGIEPSADEKDYSDSAKATIYSPQKADKDNVEQISTEELKEVMKLKQRDTEVRAHEQAHLASAGQFAAGGASFSYQTGPDGKRYATGGEVPIDMSKETTPEETIQKMQTVARAALAPATPSPADRNIAARATQIQAQARREIQEDQIQDQPSAQTNEGAKPDQNESNQSGITISQGTGSTATPNSVNSISQNSRQMILKTYSDNQS